jgi:hypothetical protein
MRFPRLLDYPQACHALPAGGACTRGAAKLTDPQIAHIAQTAGHHDAQALNKENMDVRSPNHAPRSYGGEHEAPALVNKPGRSQRQRHQPRLGQQAATNAMSRSMALRSTKLTLPTRSPTTRR